MEKSDAIDKIFLSLKWNGRYQTTRSAVLLLSLVATCIHCWSVVFIGKSVDHRCRRPDSLNITIDNVTHDVMSNTSHDLYSVTYGKCSIDVLNGSDVIFTTHCSSGYQYVESYDSSFVPEWDLVCERKYLSDASQTVFVLGQFFGELLTRFADTHGRRKIFLVTSVMSLVTAVICSLPSNFGLYLISNFIAGAFIISCYKLCGILMLEMMPKSRRALPEQIQSFLWPMSLLLLCLIAYVSRNLSWRYVQLILSMTSVYTLSQPWIIDESLRWLFVANKIDEAEKLVKKIARINQVDPQMALELIKEIRVSEGETKAMDETKSKEEKLLQVSTGQITPDQKTQDHHTNDYNLLVFVKNKNLLKITVISSSVMLVDVLAYEGLLMISPTLTSDFYVGFTLATLTEFPAAILFCLLINRIKRKTCIGIFHIMAGVLLLISTVFLHTPLSDIIPGNYWLSLLLSLLARLTLNTGYSAVLLYVPELFPTSIRSTGYAVAMTLSYLAGMVSPYTRSVSQQYPWVPNVAFGLMCIMVPIATLSLPETQGYELPQTLADMESRMKNK